MGLLPRIRSLAIAGLLLAAAFIAVDVFSVMQRENKNKLHSSVKLREIHDKNEDRKAEEVLQPVGEEKGDEAKKSIRAAQLDGDSEVDEFARDDRGRIIVPKEMKDELSRRLAEATERKLIVVWHSEFGDKFRVDFNTGECGNCELTYDRNKITDPRTGGVVFHYNALIDDPTDMPKSRNLDHLWIYWVLESSYTLKLKQKDPLTYEDSLQFNATLTYRRDSDFYMSYEKDSGTIKDLVVENKNAVKDLLKQKTKLGITFVTNCGFTHTAAWIRFLNLREIFEIDHDFEGYGGCFERGRSINGRGESFRRKVREYNFYFAFENSFHCKDYITEKFFHNALKSLSLPVVWGPSKEDYLKVIPQGSFIHADDFSSMKELVTYLRYLDKNDTAYMEYFRWLTMDPKDMPQYGRARSWCQICRALHGINIDDIYNPNFSTKSLKRPLFTNGIGKRTVPSLSGWFYGEDNPECFYDWIPVMLNRTLE